MRSQTDIRADLAIASAAWERARATQPEAEAARVSAQVKALKVELNAVLTAGSEPCETCGAKPVGLRHVRAMIGKPVQFVHAYEVGCGGACRDKRAVASTPPESVGADLDQYAEATIAKAVARWNAETYLPAAAGKA